MAVAASLRDQPATLEANSSFSSSARSLPAVRYGCF